MLAEERKEENFLEKNHNTKKITDVITLYFLVEYLKSQNYVVKFTANKDFYVSYLLVEDIKFKDNTVEIALNFKSFFGYSGLWNDYLFEMLIYEKNHSLPDFLNIFYNRIVETFVQANKIKYPYFSKNIYSMMYASITGLTSENDRPFLEFGSYLVQNCKSRHVLESLLTQFTHMPVRIIEFAGGKLVFDESYQAKLIKAHRLNGEKHLGLKYFHPAAGFNVILYPQNEKDLIWIRNLENIKKLRVLVNKFMKTRLEFNMFAELEKTKKSKLTRPGSKDTDFLGFYTFVNLREEKGRFLFKLRG